MKMMGVGNEQWGPQYIERYVKFSAVLKKAHPEIMLVSDAGPSPDDERFKFLWPKLGELHADIVDQHCYANPSWFFNNTHRYDNYDPSGPKVFMGEYAAQSVKTVSPKNRNTLECALAEAAYLTGLERNAAVVRMASYAPLFGNVDAWQWTPDLIWVDNHRIYGTPDYYTQQLFSRNRGDAVLPVTTEDPNSTTFFASAVRDNESKEVIIKVVNAKSEKVGVSIQLKGAAAGTQKAQATVLTGDNLADENSFEQPRKVAPVVMPIGEVGAAFDYTFKPNSLTVLRIGSANP
jgi:alpha-N-arabinofuranosidase